MPSKLLKPGSKRTSKITTKRFERILGGLLLVFLATGIVMCSQRDKDRMNAYQDALVNSPTRAKEVTLRENLKLVRDAIEVFMTQEGRYPESLSELTIRHHHRVTAEH